MPGCTKRYTDPSSLRKHVKNHALRNTVNGQLERRKSLAANGSAGKRSNTNTNTSSGARRHSESSITSTSSLKPYSTTKVSIGGEQISSVLKNSLQKSRCQSCSEIKDTAFRPRCHSCDERNLSNSTEGVRTMALGHSMTTLSNSTTLQLIDPKANYKDNAAVMPVGQTTLQQHYQQQHQSYAEHKGHRQTIETEVTTNAIYNPINNETATATTATLILSSTNQQSKQLSNRFSSMNNRQQEEQQEGQAARLINEMSKGHGPVCPDRRLEIINQCNEQQQLLPQSHGLIVADDQRQFPHNAFNITNNGHQQQITNGLGKSNHDKQSEGFRPRREFHYDIEQQHLLAFVPTDSLGEVQQNLEERHYNTDMQYFFHNNNNDLDNPDNRNVCNNDHDYDNRASNGDNDVLEIMAKSGSNSISGGASTTYLLNEMVTSSSAIERDVDELLVDQEFVNNFDMDYLPTFI